MKDDNEWLEDDEKDFDEVYGPGYDDRDQFEESPPHKELSGKELEEFLIEKKLTHEEYDIAMRELMNFSQESVNIPEVKKFLKNVWEMDVDEALERRKRQQ